MKHSVVDSSVFGAGGAGRMLNSYHLSRKWKLGFQAQGTCGLERKKRVLSSGSSLSHGFIGPDPKASLAHIFSPMGDEERIHLRGSVMSV